MDRPCLSMPGLVLAGGFLVFSIATTPGLAAPPGGVALVLGATIQPVADSLSAPHALAPDELIREAAAPGPYDIWLFVYSRRPLVGAWTVDIAFDFDRRPGHGIDIEAWEPLTPRSVAHAGFPDAGPDHGIRLEWSRPDCFDANHSDLLAGNDGWFRQSALRLRVRVHDPDVLALVDPEPGVPATLVQCFDDAFRLDGEDGWTRYDGPSFSEAEPATESRPIPESKTPTRITTWGELKARIDSSGSRP